MANAQTQLLCQQQSRSSQNTKSPTMPPALHADFVEVKVHTAKCDSCEKHNKLTLYRCLECGQHVCSLCWNKKRGDRTHIFRRASRSSVSGLKTEQVVEEDDGTDGGEERLDEEAGRTYTRRRRRVPVISDDEDDDLPVVLKPAASPAAPTTTTNHADATNASQRQPKKKKTSSMDHDLHEDYIGASNTLWPIVPDRRPREPRLTAPNANTGATGIVNRVPQSNSSIQGEQSDQWRQTMVRVHNNQGRQMISGPHAVAGDQEIDPQAHFSFQYSSSLQRASHDDSPDARTLPLRRQVEEERQANYNQRTFQNSQPTNRQAPRPVQPSTARQRGRHVDPTPISSYRPRPIENVDLQAIRHERAFQNSQLTTRQAPRPVQPSTARQQGPYVELTPAPLNRPRVDVDREALYNQLEFHKSQIAGLVEQLVVRETPEQRQARIRQALNSRQNMHPTLTRDRIAGLVEQPGVRETPEQRQDRIRQTLISRQDVQPTLNRDQIAAHNRRVFLSNQQSPSAQTYPEQMMAVRDHQQVYLPGQQANHPIPGSARTSTLRQLATNLFPSVQASRSQQHAANQAPRQPQHQIITQDRLNGPSMGLQTREVCQPAQLG